MKIDSSKDSSIIRDGTNKKYDVFKIVRPKIDISSEHPEQNKCSDRHDAGQNKIKHPVFPAFPVCRIRFYYMRKREEAQGAGLFCGQDGRLLV